jgi:hypothetical protein
MSFKSFNASQKKMYLFALFVIDTLKATGIVREDFDTFNVDLALVETFDYDAFTAEYKLHFKKPRANKILKHSSQLIRDTSNDVVVTVANEYYENISFDINAAIAAAADADNVTTDGIVDAALEKPKRKITRKPKAAAITVTTADAIDELSSALDNMIIQTESIADTVAAATTAAAADAVEKPKRKVTRKPKAVAITVDAAAAAVTTADAVDELSSALDNMIIQTESIVDAVVAATDATAVEKPKRKVTRKPKTNNEVVVQDEAAAEVDEKAKVKVKAIKAKANHKANVEVDESSIAAADEVAVVECPGKNKRKYTKKTAIHFIDENVPELTAKIVVAAISGEENEKEKEKENEKEEKDEEKEKDASDSNQHQQVDIVPAKKVKAKTNKATNKTSTDDVPPVKDNTVIVVEDNRPSTPILYSSIENELTAEDYTEYQDDENDEGDDNVITRKCNIRGTDYLIGDNNSIYDFQTQNTIGKFDSKNGVILYNNA